MERQRKCRHWRLGLTAESGQHPREVNTFIKWQNIAENSFAFERSRKIPQAEIFLDLGPYESNYRHWMSLGDLHGREGYTDFQFDAYFKETTFTRPRPYCPVERFIGVAWSIT